MFRRIGGFVVAVTFPFIVSGCAVEGDEDASLDELEVVGGIDPVVWIHGCNPPFVTPEQTSHFTDPQRAFFASKGYPENYLFRFVAQGPWCNSAIDNAEQISDFVDMVLAQTGRPRVDMVAHSINGARLYLLQGGNRKVRDFVSIAGANHGAETAIQALGLRAAFGYPFYEGLKEMYPTYACQGQTLGGAADIQAATNGCLTPTGRTVNMDETINGGVDYLTIRTPYDEQAVPAHTTCLNQDFIGDCSDTDVNKEVQALPDPTGPCPIPGGCPAHVAMLYNPTVMQMVYNHLSHADDGDDASNPSDPDDDDSD